MRISALIIGFILLIAGVLIATEVFSFRKTETVAKLGPLEVTTTERTRPAPVVGYVLFGVGALVLVVGFASRK